MIRSEKQQKTYLSKKGLHNYIIQTKRVNRKNDKDQELFRKKLLEPHIVSLEMQFLWKIKKKLKITKTNFSKSKINTVQFIPRHFSLVDNCADSYKFIFHLFNILYTMSYEIVTIDYSNCEKLDLDAQVLMDVILNEFIQFFKRQKKNKKQTFTKTIKVVGNNNEEINKILYSIGSFKIHRNFDYNNPNIIPYNLCIGSKSSSKDRLAGSKKEIDITNLVDYIQDCLKRTNRNLTTQAKKQFSVIVGEILGNAEEHSTNNKRYSIGFFEERSIDLNDIKSGIFNLVIFNLGLTIYEKFKNPDLLFNTVVKRMKELSSKFRINNLFSSSYNEESLWTLYALQEGVTSVIEEKRGNGSIQFIDNFLKLKGIGQQKDSVSKLTLISGNTRITFDGHYALERVEKDGNKFDVIAFNKNNNLEELPDKRFVTFTENYFPGTMIVAKIFISQNDLISINVPNGNVND